jgi:Tol biopolymer transport system component
MTGNALFTRGRSRLALILTLLGCPGVFSCGGDPAGPSSDPPPSVASVTVTPADASLLALGDTVRLAAAARDSHGGAVAGRTFVWVSSDTGVATVNATGLVTAVSNGSSNVSATTGGVTGSASVAVQAPTTGGLRLMTTTVGRNLDPDGYSAFLDGNDLGSIGPNASMTIEGLEPGSHTVALTGQRDTCHEFYEYPISATVVAGSVVDVPLGVECLGILPEIYLAFARSEFAADPPAVHIMGLVDGEPEPVQLTFRPAADWSPDWSPDGTRLAFSRNGVIHVMSADGTELRSFEEGTNPDWSPDGTRIAYDNGTRTFVFEPDGAMGRTFIGDGTAPAWSPDGTRIAVDDLVTQNQTDIFTLSSNGGSRVNITDNAMRADREPSWSPDGSRMVFRRLNRRENTGYDIWIMNSDGSNPVEVFAGPAADINPEWLPDDRILFAPGQGGIAILDPGDGSLTPIVNDDSRTTSANATWRPAP